MSEEKKQSDSHKYFKNFGDYTEILKQKFLELGFNYDPHGVWLMDTQGLHTYRLCASVPKGEADENGNYSVSRITFWIDCEYGVWKWWKDLDNKTYPKAEKKKLEERTKHLKARIQLQVGFDCFMSMEAVDINYLVKTMKRFDKKRVEKRNEGKLMTQAGYYAGLERDNRSKD